METLSCQFCDSEYDSSEDVCGCCSIRCALDAGRIDECPYCMNTGVMEISHDPYVSECILCIEGCAAGDWWVDEPFELPIPELIPLDDSDVPF